MKQRIKPKFKGRAIPLKAFRNIVFNKAFKITPGLYLNFFKIATLFES